ncbi:MAG: hypothetical protein L0H29_04270 [Sinobacteraceae bacterium]|nr:hypothetical protein [Nevskiaceae bacterium]
MAEASEDTNWIKNILVLLLLTGAYYFGVRLCDALTAAAGVGWLKDLSTAWSLSHHGHAVLMSLLNLVEISVIAIPVGGIIGKMVPRHAVWIAILVAFPGCLPFARILWLQLSSPWMLQVMGLHFTPFTIGLMSFDGLKTLLLPSIFTVIVPRLLPAKR